MSILWPLPTLRADLLYGSTESGEVNILSSVKCRLSSTASFFSSSFLRELAIRIEFLTSSSFWLCSCSTLS